MSINRRSYCCSCGILQWGQLYPVTVKKKWDGELDVVTVHVCVNCVPSAGLAKMNHLFEPVS